MPAILLERIPLPSLQTYTTFTVVLLACALFYAHQIVMTDPVPSEEGKDTDGGPEEHWNITLPHNDYWWNLMYVMTVEVWCIWTLVNTAYCCLILLGKLIQHLVFGELRVSEQQHLKDKFWNFVFYKFIFIFGVMNVQSMDEMLLWIGWFSALGFLSLLTQLSKDRFEYLSFSPTTTRSAHGKLIGLLFIILLSSSGLLVLCVFAGLQVGLTIFAFMAAECLLLMMKTLYVVVRYAVHLWDLSCEGVWENRSSYIYYTELVFELAVLSVDFAHHLHMLLWGNIFLSMASLVICMQLRYIFYELQRRIRRHKNYLRVIKNMEAKFPMATQEELEKNADDCAICWEKMDTARRLPCSHLFHNSCLRSWLEQDTSCPTCRTSLSDGQERDPSGNTPRAPRNADNNPPAANAAAANGTTNHFFHFDGSRYVSWLPSFSVEVTHTRNLLSVQAPQITSQLDNMARQVQIVFPDMPLAAIIEDLRVTRSVDLTIDNILEGHLLLPAGSHPGMMALQAAVHDMEVDAGSQVIPGNSAHALTTLSGPQSSRRSSDDSHSQPDLANFGSDGIPSASGSRFSKSAFERMSMLEQRKAAMLEQARRKFLQQQTLENSSLESEILEKSDSKESNKGAHNNGQESGPRYGDNRQLQREVILEATQRRLGQGTSTTG